MSRPISLPINKQKLDKDQKFHLAHLIKWADYSRLSLCLENLTEKRPTRQAQKALLMQQMLELAA